MAFANHLKGRRPCEVFSGRTRLLIEVERRVTCYYPDIMIDCRPESRTGPGLRNPTLVVEILSPSTARIDKSEKTATYREVDSIEEYVIVAQDKYELTIHRRADGWRSQVYRGPDPIVEFRAIALTLPMRSIYDDVLLARG
jgi:Uma2 family endonuclease